MVSAELVTPVSIATLVCPYCCRPMPRDIDGMRAAHSAWGFCAGLARENGHVIGLVLVFQKKIVSGLTAGAVKG